jgi:hypothetical protein
MRNSLKLSALDAVLLLARVISMFVIDAANITGAIKTIAICLIAVACLYIFIKLLKLNA